MAAQAAAKFVQLPRKPPVTTALIAVQTFIHLRPGKFDAILPTVSEVCLNPYFIIKVRNVSLCLVFFPPLYRTLARGPTSVCLALSFGARASRSPLRSSSYAILIWQVVRQQIVVSGHFDMTSMSNVYEISIRCIRRGTRFWCFLVALSWIVLVVQPMPLNS